MNTSRALLALAALAATSGAFAQTAEIVGRGIDPNTFIVGHPASPRWVLTHANGEHPAVLQARQTRAAVDVNTFLVQPPAAVQWLAREPAAPVRLAQAAK